MSWGRGFGTNYKKIFIIYELSSSVINSGTTFRGIEMARIELLSAVTGKVWKIQISEGVDVSEDESIMIIESMKMEIPVFNTVSGKLIQILVKEGDTVKEGQVVAVVEA